MLEKSDAIANVRVQVVDHCPDHFVIIKSYKKKFQQTENTPCMVQPLRQLLGPLANTSFADDILEGHVQLPNGTNS